MMYSLPTSEMVSVYNLYERDRHFVQLIPGVRFASIGLMPFASDTFSASRAIGGTVVILLAINLGPALVLAPVLEIYPALVFCGFTPIFLIEMPMSWYRFVAMQYYWDQGAWLFLAPSLGIPLAHALAAWFLTRAALRRVETAFLPDALSHRGRDG